MNKTIAVPVGVLEMLISMSNSHVEDITSGIEEGIYDAADNKDIGQKEQVVATAEALLRSGVESLPDFPRWREVAATLAGALDSCTTEIEQMKGMFNDGDGNIQSALDDADQASDAYQCARAAAELDETVRDQLAIWLATQADQPGATLLQCVGKVAPRVGQVRTGVKVVAFHGSLGPIEATAEGAIVPDGRVYVAGPFSYGSNEADEDMGEDQIDIALVRFPDGIEEQLLSATR